MLEVSILPLSTILLLDFGTVPTLWYLFVFHFIRMFFVMHTHLYTSKYSLNSKKADQCLQTYVNTSVYFNISHLITSLNYICIQTQKDIKINIYLIILHLLIMLHSQWRKYLNYRQML